MLNRLPLKWSARIIDVFLLEGEKLVLDIYQRIYYLSANSILKLKEKHVNFSKKKWKKLNFLKFANFFLEIMELFEE